MLNKWSKNEFFGKALYFLFLNNIFFSFQILEHQYMEFLHAQLSLHSISSQDKREYYRNFFGSNAASFIHDLYEYVSKNPHDEFSILMIKFSVEVLQRDLFHWRKHDMMHRSKTEQTSEQKKLDPLISVYKAQTELSWLVKDIKSCKIDIGKSKLVPNVSSLDGADPGLSLICV